jgi:glycerate kinase
MKFLIAPDKFKGSLTGFEYCDAVEEGIRMVFPHAEIIKKPLADGGDGTIDVVKHYIGGKRVVLTANDPLFRPLKAAYVFSKAKAVAFIEMAEISGLKLLAEPERNCMYTTSLGFGELIVDAIDKGGKKLILGIGGSATNDGGMGMAQALGFSFLDVAGKELKPVGSNLGQLRIIDTSNVRSKLKDVQFKVACDVSNPLYGPNGAASIYGSQKGASSEEIEELDRGLENYAKVVKETFGVDVQNIKGAGAAGGMGAGCAIFLNAELVSGIDLIKEISDFDASLENVDWIITGEGQLDSQTFSGKTISGVLASAKNKNISVAALCGSVALSKAELVDFNLGYVSSISEHCKNLTEAMANAYSNLVEAAGQFAKSLGTNTG